MVKKYIRQDKDHPVFVIAKNDIYRRIESDSRLSSLVTKTLRHAESEKEFKNNPNITKKDIKRYLAFRIFTSYGGDADKLIEYSDKNAHKVIYDDLVLFES